MTEDEVQRATGDLAASGLDDETVAALRLVDVLTTPHAVVDDELDAELHRHFDHDQILELGVALALTTGWQRFIEAFGIRPDSWAEGEGTSEASSEGTSP